jgi:hypothetical protein
MSNKYLEILKIWRQLRKPNYIPHYITATESFGCNSFLLKTTIAIHAYPIFFQ